MYPFGKPPGALRVLCFALSMSGTLIAGLENGGIWPDDNGVHINAHGGGILHHQGVYYWFGEHKVAGMIGNTAQVGVHVYSSTDLIEWKDRGIALQVSEDPGNDIAKGCILERPKVIYNPRTEQFVMWFHLELKGSSYASARSGVAVADEPAGPYTFLKSMRPEAGYWPLNVAQEHQDSDTIKEAQAAEAEEPFGGGPSDRTRRYNLLGAHFAEGQMARDMNLFVDDDGSAYHIYSSEHNSTLHISRLTDDFLDHSGAYVRVFEHRWMEAPALFKRGGKYYLIASGCTGWAPNAARSAVADNVFGPWTELDNPCTGINSENGMGPDKTFGGQSTCVFQVTGSDDFYVAMFDLWRPRDAIDGRYVWLRIEFDGEGFRIPWKPEWKLR